MSSVENKGVFSKLGDGMSNLLGSFLDLPVTIPRKLTKDPVVQKDMTTVLNVIFSLGAIALGVGMMALALHGMNPGGLLSGWNGATFAQALTNPSWSVLMAAPMSFGLVGLGTTWALRSVLGNGYHRRIGMIMKIVSPILLLGGGICFMGGAFMLHGGTLLGLNYYFWAGLAMVFLSGVLYCSVTRPALNERRRENVRDLRLEAERKRTPGIGKRMATSMKNTWLNNRRNANGFRKSKIGQYDKAQKGAF